MGECEVSSEGRRKASGVISTSAIQTGVPERRKEGPSDFTQEKERNREKNSNQGRNLSTKTTCRTQHYTTARRRGKKNLDNLSTCRYTTIPSKTRETKKIVSTGGGKGESVSLWLFYENEPQPFRSRDPSCTNSRYTRVAPHPPPTWTYSTYLTVNNNPCPQCLLPKAKRRTFYPSRKEACCEAIGAMHARRRDAFVIGA